MLALVYLVHSGGFARTLGLKDLKDPFYYAHARRRGSRGTYLPRPVLSEGSTTSEVSRRAIDERRSIAIGRPGLLFVTM